MPASLNLTSSDVFGLLLLLAIAGVMGFALLAYYIARALTLPPRRTAAWAVSKQLASDPTEVDLARYGFAPRKFSTWSINEESGPRFAINVWEFAGDDPQGPISVLTHGWADSCLGALVRVEPFVKWSSRVVLWDLPGHGQSGASCRLGQSEHRILAKIIAQLSAEDQLQSADIVLAGWSLGCGVTLAAIAEDAQLAARTKLVVLEAPYCLPQTPAIRVMAMRGLGGIVTKLALHCALTVIGGIRWQRRGGPFDRAALAKKLPKDLPVVLVHGTDDQVCPASESSAIASGLGNATVVMVVAGGHNDLWINPAFRSQVVQALEQKLQPVLQRA